MYRVVLDTNCLLAILSSKSIYYHLWKGFQDGKYNLCVSNEILEEYQEIIAQLTNQFVAENVIEFILNSPFCLRFDPQYRFNLIQEDPDDNKFVDCAIIANADYIVSDDKHFNKLKHIPFPRVEVKRLDDFHQELIHNR